MYRMAYSPPIRIEALGIQPRCYEMASGLFYIPSLWAFGPNPTGPAAKSIPCFIEFRKRMSGYSRVQIPAAALLSIVSKIVFSVNQGGKGAQRILREKAISKES